MDEGVQALSQPTHDLWQVPLARMSCAIGAAYEPDADELRFPGDATGFAVYGPYLPVEPGVYEVVVDVALTGQKNPKLHFDLWIEGKVLTKQAVLLDRGRITLRGWVPVASRLEVRAHTVSTGFVIYGIGARRLDPADEVEISSTKAAGDLRRQQFRTVLGLSAEEAPDHSPPVENLLDSIFSDSGFLFLDDSEVASHQTALVREGILPLSVQLLFARNNTRSMRMTEDPHTLMDGYPDVSNAFQLDILRDGALVIPSLFGQGTMTSRVSFPVLSPKSVVNLLYEFTEPHHVITGVNTSWIGSLSFVWFVDHNVLIYDARLHWLTDYEPTLSILRRFVTVCAQHRGAARAYRAAAKTTACISGFITNMGHYFWNEVSGLERVLRAGHRPQLLLADARWLPLREIFSDDGLSIVAEVDPDCDALFLKALDRNLFLVRPTGNAIDAPLAAKIEKGARRVLDAEQPGKIAHIKITTDGALVLFFNLRAHNKSWLEQIDGAVEVVARLNQLDASRRIVLFLDGYADCIEIAGEIRARLASTCQVVDGTQVPFAETLAWAYRCDLFVAVVGSGLVPLTWLAGKPGVCHGDPRHLDQMAFWPLVRKGYNQLSWPRHEDILTVEDAWYANYSISTTLIADLLISRFHESRGFVVK